jgi:hypothetical protein
MMNERIEELAEQCGFRSNPNVYDRNQSFDIEKFANLIVKDCALTAGLMEIEGRKNIGAQLLDNFGVKE